MKKANTKRTRNSVEAVQVAVRILDELAHSQRAMRVTELAEILNETKPRIHRHLSTLKESGIVEQDQSTDKYRLGWRVFQLGEAAGSQYDLRQLGEPYLLKIRDELRQTAVLAVPSNGEAMVVSTADNIYSRIFVSVKPGNRPIPHGSAIGRVTLAFSPKRYIDAVLSKPIIQETRHTLIDPDAIRKRLALIRKRYFDLCDSEVMLGINTIAVPIFRDQDELAGVIGIVGSLQDIPNPPKQLQIEYLQDCAAEISSQIRGTIYKKILKGRRDQENYQV